MARPWYNVGYNAKGHQNCIIGSTVTASFLNIWILFIVGIASERVCVHPAKQACFLYKLFWPNTIFCLAQQISGNTWDYKLKENLVLLTMFVNINIKKIPPVIISVTPFSFLFSLVGIIR